MVCTANDLSAWKDFPKGLRVLLLDEDTNSAAEIKSKLEAMDYIVSTFCNENDALSAISGKPESFHVAIVEVSSSNSDGSLRFLENAKDLPTIMTANVHCLSTMMKCIALGAVEFLRKPLSEDKLSNIWQHVVHKAFSAGGSILPESLKPVKDSVVSMLQLEVESEEHKEKSTEKTENLSPDHVDDYEPSQANDKYPAPSTPQLKQGGRLLDDGDCQDHTNCSTEKESAEQGGESKSVENTCRVDEVTLDKGHPQSLRDTVLKTEDDLADGVNRENNSCLHPQKGEKNSCGPKVNRKKLKVDWTTELHKKFVRAVEHLGIDQAIPSRIHELMKVEGLTRHNVASHLQKYRMHTRNILPKQDDGRWLLRQRDQIQRSYYPHRPMMAYPLYPSGHKFPHGPAYPMWGATGIHPVMPTQMWGPPSYPSWTPAKSWHWKPYPGMQADAWGCPVMPLPPPQAPFPTFPQAICEFQRAADNASSFPLDSVDLQPAEDVIDNVVKEAINKPWLPLPLGLKPPSTDSVLAELSRQGISTVPPHHHQRL